VSDYHSNEAAVEAARLGDSELNKGATLMGYLLKESWTTALSLTEQGQMGLPEKNTTSKKELLTPTPCNVADGRS
jgi:hypothetical protein